jgi:hypothetical protein
MQRWVLDMTTALDFVENYTGDSPSMDRYRYATGFSPLQTSNNSLQRP